MKSIVLLAILLLSWGSPFAQLVGTHDIVDFKPAIELNADGDQRAPAVLKDGLFYLDSRPTNARQRRWARKNDRAPQLMRWATLENQQVFAPQGKFADQANSSYVEGPVAFSSRYDRMFFSREVAPPGVKGRKRIRQLRRAQLFVSDKLDDGDYSAGVELPFNDASANQLHPTLSADGNMLVFASDRDGGYGGLDLWASAYSGGEWGEPYNLGQDINTDDDDAYPFLDVNGNLYFSSRTVDDPMGVADSDEDLGFTGDRLDSGVLDADTVAISLYEDPEEFERDRFGRAAGVDLAVERDVEASAAAAADYDLYVAFPRNAIWQNRTSLGWPFNSEADDTGFVLDSTGRVGYMTSARRASEGGSNLYSFRIRRDPRLDPPRQLTLQISDASTGAPLAGTNLVYLNTSEISLAEALRRGLIDDEGKVLIRSNQLEISGADGLISFETNPGEYLLSLSQKSYETLDLPLAIEQSDVTVPLAMVPGRPCMRVAIAVVDAESFDPLSSIEVRLEGQLESSEFKGNTSEDGIVNLCVPCGDIYGMQAIDGLGGRSNPGSVDARDSLCRSDRAALSTTLYFRSGSTTNDNTFAVNLGGERGGANVPSYSEPARAESPSALAERLFAMPATVVPLPSVAYSYGGYYLGKPARSDLSHLAQIMSDYPVLHLTLGSHTDARGTRAFNEQLSSRRASEAQRYLTQELGVARSRVRAVGYGETRLLNECRDGVTCTEDQHAVNRRTEIAIVGAEDPELIAALLREKAVASKANDYADAPPLTIRRAPSAPAEADFASPARPVYKPDYVVVPEKPYWVVVGTFANDSNADRRRDEFADLGYAGIDVVRFDDTGQRAVVLAKFGALAEATQFSKAIVEAHRTGAYVRRVE